MNLPPRLARILILCVCMLGSYFVQGQTSDPTISQPVVESGSICPGTDVEISFQVTNGYTRTWFIFIGDYIPFTTSTNYKISLKAPNGTTHDLKTFTSTTAPGGTSIYPFSIRTTATIPEEFTGTGYTIEVRSTNPDANSAASNTFSINSLPTLNFSGATSLCSGGTFNLTGTVTGAGNKTVVLRDVNNNFLSSVSVPSTFTFSRTISSTTTYNFEVTDANGCVLRQQLTVNVGPSAAPTLSNNGPICVGGTLRLTASTVSGATYRWTGPGINTTTTSNILERPNATTAMAGTYQVTTIVNGCESNPARTTVEGSLSNENQTTAGNNSWIGHVYDGTNFGTYVGRYAEQEEFTQSFGGDTNCFAVSSGSGTNSVYTETFSARYLNKSSKNGLFVADLRSDDGIRFKINGNTVHDNWVPRSPTTDSNVLLNHNQNENLLTYEYYENGGGNEIGFQNFRKVVGNDLTGGTDQTLCGNGTSQPIVGDAISLVSGITTIGTGYQWVYSTTETGDKIEIPGANQKDYTPDLSSTPFNTPGEYFIYRRVRLQSTNNRLNGVNNYTTTHTSNAANLLIEQIPQVQFTANPMELCGGGNVELSGLFTGSGKYRVSVSVNGGAAQDIPVDNNDFTIIYPYPIIQTTTIEITSITDVNTGCVNAAPDALVTINVNQEIENNSIGGDQELCGNESIQILTGSTPQGGNGTFTYEWLSSTTGPDEGFSSIGNASSANYTPGTLSETTWFKRKVASGVCAENISDAVKVTVYDEITNNTISYSGETSSVCLGSSASGITGSQPTGGNGNSTYLWESSTTGATSGFAPAPGINSLKDYQPETFSETTWFRRNVTSSICGPASSNVVEVKVNPPPSIEISGTNTICLGETTYLTGTLFGTGPWIINGTIDGTPFSIPVDTPTFDQELIPTETTTITITGIQDSNGCVNNTLHLITITVLQENIWTGATDNNWNNANNWRCNTIPTLETDVLIPADLLNYPTILPGEAGLAKDITIESNASVDVGFGWFGIAGQAVNEGIFNAENGTVVFASNIPQIIPLGFFENSLVENLLVWNTSDVTSQADIKVKGILQVLEGNFQTGDDLTLLSNSTKTAYIHGAGTGQVVGKVKMQRYLSNAFGYKYFSTPFQNSTVDDLAANFALTNPETGFPHLYEYIEGRKDVNGDDLTGWQKYLDPSSSLEPGHGYAINPGGEPAPLTLEISGIVNNGPVNVALKNVKGEYTDGFNLVGNPYPSPIDWDLMVPNLSGIDNAIYFFNAGSSDRYTGTYSSYVNGVYTNATTTIIPSMQGFFVKVSEGNTATANLQFTNSVRVGNETEQTYYKTKNKAEIPQIRLTAAFTGEKVADATVIYFNKGGTPEFEKDLDAQKLLNTAINVPSFYSLSPKNEKLAINAISGRSIENLEIPLGISTEKSGEIHLTLSEAKNIFPSVYIYLKDNKKKIIQDLVDRRVYSFTSQKGQNNDRFVLLFSSRELSPAELLLATEDFIIYTEDDEIIVKLNLPNIENKGKVLLSSMSGQVLQSKMGYGKEEIKFSGIQSAGIYLVTLVTEKGSETKKVIFKN